MKNLSLKTDTYMQRTDGWFPERTVAGQWAKQGKGIKKYKLPVMKVITMLYTGN